MAVKKKQVKKAGPRAKSPPKKGKGRPATRATPAKVVAAEIIDTPSSSAFERDDLTDTEVDLLETPTPIIDDSEAYARRDPVLSRAEASDDNEEVDVEPEVADDENSEGPRSRKKRRLPVPIAQEPASSSEDPVTAYLAEIRRYPLLTKEQEYDLAVRFRETRDPKAAEQLVTSNLRFVVKIATEYSKFGAKLIDLIQEGNVGLMHAVREFNPYKNVRLITYAVWWIRGYIQEYLMRQYSMVRIGTTQNQRKLFYRLQKEKMRLDSMGEEPTVPLLSSRLGVTEEEVRQMSQRLSGRDISLNQPLDSDSGASLLDMASNDELGVDEQLGNAEQLGILRENIERIRPHLNEKELFILDRRLLADDPLTLQQIGEHYGVTREAVRQMEARLINRIRSSLTESLDAPKLVGRRDMDSDES